MNAYMDENIYFCRQSLALSIIMYTVPLKIALNLHAQLLPDTRNELYYDRIELLCKFDYDLAFYFESCEGLEVDTSSRPEHRY